MTSAAQLGQLMQWLSPAYPVGSFAYSHGLERAVHDGWVTDADSILPWLEDTLSDGAGFSDACFIHAAAKAETHEALQDIDETAKSMSASAERQTETCNQGRAFSQMTSALQDIKLPNPDAPFLTYRPSCYPVALGAALRAYDLPVDLAACLYLQGFCANLIGAAQRLNLIGQSRGQRILSTLMPLYQDIATAAATCDLHQIGSQCYLSDITAMRHETQTTRIFRT